MKNFNKKLRQLLEDMGLAAGAGNTTTSAGVVNPVVGQSPIGQSSDKLYAPGDARNLWGAQTSKKKKTKFKTPKNNPGFKSKFKVIRRTPPGL